MGTTRRQLITAAGLGLLGAGLAHGLGQAAWAGSTSGRIVDVAKMIAPLDLHYREAEDFPEPGPIGASELAGPRFTADGRHLFVNLQYPGTHPRHHRPLGRPGLITAPVAFLALDTATAPTSGGDVQP
ncbi:hypothetical protein [Parafrankia sp. EUN1f]|uniref:hypothetical protein n=1 Tax=Parafrankia sp. EUN1f TaxID=102897 RepID=UPI0003007D72|nr:hypothetical protein [Parafrankia sp. EUN1f]